MQIAAAVAKFFENCPNLRHILNFFFFQNPAFVLAGF